MSVRVLQVAERDGRYVATIATADDVVAGPDEVIIRVAGSGVNRADLSQIAGRYPSPPGEPPGLGLEVSGILEGRGAPVCALLAGGGHADRVAAPLGQVFPAPPNLDLVHAAAIPEAYLTAFVNLVIEAGLERGANTSVLVHAGASGVGLAAIGLAKARGARVAATTRTAAKRDALERAGADLALVSSDAAWKAELEGRFGPSAIDIVLDPVGATTLQADLELLATGGRVVMLASMGGAKAELDIPLLMKKRARVIGSVLRSRSREEKARLVRRFTGEVLPDLTSGTLAPRVDSVVPVTRAGDAFQRMKENANIGKLVIDWTI